MKVLMSYGLLIIAAVLLFVVTFCTFFVSSVYSLITFTAHKYFFDLAKSIDQTGNVLIAPLANHLLVKPDAYKFGNEDETISSVLGKNKVTDRMRFGGKFICWILNLIDKGHCLNSIDESIE